MRDYEGSPTELGHILFPVLVCYFLPRVNSAGAKLLFICLRFYLFKAAHECLVYAHYCAIVIEFSTVVSCRENGYKFSAREKLITVLLYLMASSY